MCPTGRRSKFQTLNLRDLHGYGQSRQSSPVLCSFATFFKIQGTDCGMCNQYIEALVLEWTVQMDCRMIHSLVRSKAMSLDCMTLVDGDISTCFAIVKN